MMDASEDTEDFCFPLTIPRRCHDHIQSSAMGRRPDAGKDSDKVLAYVGHVYLRDTSPTEFQVKVGQGEVDYGKIISQLSALDYRRALCVDVVETPGIEHSAEMRKMRLLLESLL